MDTEIHVVSRDDRAPQGSSSRSGEWFAAFTEELPKQVLRAWTQPGDPAPTATAAPTSYAHLTRVSAAQYATLALLGDGAIQSVQDSTDSAITLTQTTSSALIVHTINVDGSHASSTRRFA